MLMPDAERVFARTQPVRVGNEERISLSSLAGQNGY